MHINVGTVLVDENNIITLICNRCISLELWSGFMNEILSNLENMAVESIKTYFPLSVSFLITDTMSSCGSNDSIPGIET